MKILTIIDYTEKRFKGFKSKEFPSMGKAKDWVKKNNATLYWFLLRHKNPKSQLPKIVLDKTITIDEFSKLSGVEYTKISGTLETHFETGMERTDLIIYDSSKRGAKNPKFDRRKPEGGLNFKYFKTYEGIIFLKDGIVIEFEDGTKHLMIKDFQFAMDDGFRLGFYPQGYGRDEWIKLFEGGNTKVTVWIPELNRQDR